ncbi:hypothetical protein JQK15_03960 [Sphingobium sp. BHU LFT2]|uniref:hypothetical protein n=1 Tax=Sphingobium sp. BHU LFT2 TaxID=2807634 RepID=UPI001BE6E73C|nr:hypothetical protein [Sphingobium sp. BHU LFT2]MBT2242684.1 hypothetical protein [Sphingobium sp. BHU LFT2]
MTVMEGSDIIGALMGEYQPLLDLVPVTQIKAGLLPDDSPLPAIVVSGISVVDRQPLKRLALVRRTERVSVTVLARSHVERQAIIAAVRKCCAGRTGNVGDALNVAVITAGTGPDVNGPGGRFERAQDFKVSFDAFD